MVRIYLILILTLKIILIELRKYIRFICRLWNTFISCIYLPLIDTFLLLALGEDYFILEHEQSECEVFVP